MATVTVSPSTVVVCPFVPLVPMMGGRSLPVRRKRSCLLASRLMNALALTCVGSEDQELGIQSFHSMLYR